MRRILPGELKKRVYDRIDMSGDITDVALKQVIGECVQEESGLYMISIRQKEELEESVF